MFNFRKMAILTKLEGTYGVDAGPAAATDAVLLQNATLTPLEGDELTREFVRPGQGDYESVLVNKRVLLEGDVVLKGSGAAGSAPFYGKLLRCLGFNETLNAGVSAVYKLVSENYESTTIYFHRGDSTSGALHKMLGCRGTWSIKSDTNGDLLLHIAVMGNFVAPTSVAMPGNIDYTALTAVTALPVNKANTQFSLDTYAAILHALEVAANNVYGKTDVVGFEGVRITDRKVGGSFTIEEPPIATKDFYALANAATVVAQLVHGTVAGNIVQLDAARVQLGVPSQTDLDGITGLQIPAKYVPSDVGDDNDIIITVK